MKMTDNRVVISGISGRFPNCGTFGELQEYLLNKTDLTTEDHDLWEIEHPMIPKRLGKGPNLTEFDRIFFGIHTKLTYVMDPISRYLLESAFEAVMDAGINPWHLRKQNISVYSATGITEAEKCLFERQGQKDGFGIVGTSKAMIPNRISFFLDLIGSSVNIDSGCTGFASALECAYNDIKQGRTNAAIVTGSLINLHPQISYQLHKLGILSADGLTRSFDNSADGHTRSDGAVVFFVQKASEAKRIYQEVLSVKCEFVQGLLTNTMIYPTMQSQINLMREMLKKNNLTPDDIAYLEASGVGIKNVDADELNAIDEVFGKQRKKPIMVGSVKSNMGDSTAANVGCAILKMVTASERGLMPPVLNYETPNEKAVGLKEGRIIIPTEVMPLTGQYTLINTVSYTGNLSNVILKAPNIEKKNNGIPDDDIPRLVTCSGRTEESVSHILDFVESRPVDAEFLQLTYDLFRSDIKGHLHRGYTVVPAKGMPEMDTKKQEVQFLTGEKREVWWIFSGMGSQWSGMGAELLQLPVFAAAIQRCDNVLKPLGYDIYNIICDKDPKMFDNIVNSFVGIAAIQIALVDVLKAVDMEPDFIIGHSVGELGCAYADGCFTAEQMIMAALSRGLASIETKLGRGSMAAVGLGYNAIKPLCPPDIDVACHNGPDSSTISGPAESMKPFVASLTAKGIFAKEVACSNIAYHSRYIAPAGTKLLERLQTVIPKPNVRSSKWISTSLPRQEWNTVKARLSSAEYHTNNLLSPVLFEESSRLIPHNAVCIEIAPHGLLQAIVKKSLPKSCINIPLTKRGHPNNLEFMLAALGKIYNTGLNPNISNLYPKVEYPVGRGTPSISTLIKWDHNTPCEIRSSKELLKAKGSEKTFQINLNNESEKYLKGNIINGQYAIPLSFQLLKVWEVFNIALNNESRDIVFEDITVHKMLVTVPKTNILEIVVMILKGNGNFEVIESNELLLSGTIRSTQATSQELLSSNMIKSSAGDTKYDLSKDDFYSEMQMRGFGYLGEFRSVLKSSIDGRNGLVRWNDNWVTFIDSVLQLRVLQNDSRRVETPYLIRKIVIDQNEHASAINNSKDVQVFINKEFSSISAGGLELQNIKLAVVPKTTGHNSLGHDILTVVPNLEKSSLPLSTTLRLILQLVIENMFSHKVQRVQLISKDDQKLETFKASLLDVPERSLVSIDIIPYEEATFNKALTVIVDDIEKYNINEIAEKLGINKFLLIFTNADKLASVIKLVESQRLGVVFIRNYKNESVILLRKRRVFSNIYVINASKNINDTVSKIKNTKLSLGNERIVVTVKSKDKINFVDFVHRLESLTEIEKIIFFFIQDIEVSENPFVEGTFKAQLELDLLVNLISPSKAWSTFRRVEVNASAQLCTSWIANQASLHKPNEFIWTEGPMPENNTNVIKVEYSTLNTQDIFLAKGCYYSDPSEMIGKNRIEQKSMGLEFSGVDSKGSKVFGVTCSNAMANFVNPDSAMTWTVPRSWSLEDAATVPLSYIVAYSALLIKADIQKEDKVLLTNCCNGIGLAILNIVVQKKCDLYVAYKTEAERKFILSLGLNISPNRLYDISNNNYQHRLFVENKGRRMDVIICNQCRVKEMESFFSIAENEARIVLISDLIDDSFYENFGMEIFLRQIALFSVVPKRILLSDLETKKNLINMINEGINSGTIKPLSRTVYNRESLNEAYNACVTNKHFGKIVVKVHPEASKTNQALAFPRLHCQKSKSYVIIEGLTAFGIELIDWLITRGAKNLVVASSFKNDNCYKNHRLSILKNYGVQMVLHQDVDLSQQRNIKAVFKEALSLGPVDAVFDLRRINTSTKLSQESANLTTKILDEESRSLCSQLRLFFIFTATANIRSMLASSKFGYINTMINTQDPSVHDLLERRKKDGLHGLLCSIGLFDINDKNNTLCPEMNYPVTNYLEKIDEVLGIKELTVDVSLYAPITDECEVDVVDVEKKALDLIYKEANYFRNRLCLVQTEDDDLESHLEKVDREEQGLE